jgi:transcription initiation factor TFIIB
LAGKLFLPKSVVTEANVLFQRAVHADLNRGRDNASLIYASVYAAALVQGVPKTPFEVTAFSPITKTKMLRSYRNLVRAMNFRAAPIKPQDILPRFGSRLNLSLETVNRASEILEEANKILPEGKRPETIVASALYLAAKETGEDRTQRQVANTTGVIEVTIRKITKKLICVLAKQNALLNL